MSTHYCSIHMMKHPCEYCRDAYHERHVNIFSKRPEDFKETKKADVRK